MKRFIIILTLFSYLFPQDGKLAVSILDFTGEDVSDKLLRACYQKLETSLIESNQYTVIAKNQRDEILEEQKIQNSGICDEDCAVEIGQLIGAEYLMLGNIIGFPDLYQVNIKIINIEKGDVVQKVTKEIQGNLSDLLNGMAESSREITRRIVSGGGQIIPQQSGMEIVQKKYGSIIIESTPSGATVLIDNVKKGSTPLELKNIEVGTRKLKLIKSGYVTISKGVIINEKKPINVSEVFILKTGDLTITSEPTGAMVYINGAIKGKTPYTITELTIGDYNVTVSSENYHDKTERVMVEYDSKNSKNFILQPKPGTVTIIINPPEAKISVGYKQYEADAEGIASIELPVGQYKIDFKLTGYESVTKNVTLLANEKKSLEVSMYLAKVIEEATELAQEGEVAVIPSDTAKDTGLKIGDIAPSWALMSGPGKFEFLKTWTEEKGKKLRKPTTQPDRHVVVLSFFATWCKPCMKELPHLQNLYEKYKNDNIKFFLIDITEATRTVKGWEDSPKAGPFLANKGITMPILFDSRGVAKERYGAKTLPRLFVIDKYRTIQLAKTGFDENEDFEAELSAVLDRLSAEE
jgi:thiol-disulfide isomerase/thioredoxin